MTKEKFHVYGVTGYTMPDNEVPLLFYNAQHLETRTEQEPLVIEPIQANGDHSNIPLLLPPISKF